MKRRCNNPSLACSKYYLEKGITYCKEWEYFKNFLNDMGQCSKGMTLDRIDSNGNYNKYNCKWSTPKEQTRNRSNTIFVTFNGETHSLKEWESIVNIPYNILLSRLKDHKWSIDRTLTYPYKIRLYHRKKKETH